MNVRILCTFAVMLALAHNAVSADVNALTNPGFETGALTPWIGASWTVGSGDAHSGSYAAETTSGATLKQFIDPIPVDLVHEVGVWCRSVDMVEHPVRLLYDASGSDWDEFLMWPTTSGWSRYDLTADLRAVGFLHGLLVFGSYAHMVRCDDARIMADEAVAAVPATWSGIKRLYR